MNLQIEMMNNKILEQDNIIERQEVQIMNIKKRK